MTKEAVMTLVDKDLKAIVWRDPNGRQVFYKTEPMTDDEISDLFKHENRDIPKVS